MRFAVLLGAVSLWGQGELGRPFLGQMIDQHGALRPVFGVSGNFSVGAPSAQRVLASACSLTLCLAKTESELISPAGRTQAPPGGAQIALDATGATVYFPRIRQFERWQNGSLTKLDVSVEGTVLSIATGNSGLSIAVERGGTVWVVSADGSILDSLPAEASAVLLLPTLTVYATPDSLVLRKSDGSELRFPAPGVGSLTALGDGYVEASAGGVLYALRTLAGREQLYELPQPEVVASPVQLTVVVGSQATVVASGSAFSLGQIVVGAVQSFVIQVLNTGTAPVTIEPNGIGLSGAGFAITSPLTLPPNIAPGAVLNVYLQFSASLPAAYSANFQFNTSSIVLTATAIAAATLTAAAPCTGPDSSLTINFGNVAVSQSVTCSMVLVNQSTQAVTVSNVSVSGPGFLFSAAPATPLNLPPGVSSQPFAVTFAPNSAMVYAGALTVDSRTYPLLGTSSNPVIPAPMLQFDTQTPQSGQQITLTMTLPVASPIAVTGSINLAFRPQAGLSVSDDPTVNFVTTEARSVPFAIQPGSMQATLNGQSGAVFATGTTAGKITFTVSTSAQLNGDPTTSIVLAPMPILVDNAAATALAGELNIQVWAFDNTYSAGPMSFTFLDNLGNAIGAGPITADFTSNFQSYFSNSTDGGAFAMLLTFPITGNAAAVGSVNLQMNNSAGTSTITNLVFLNDTGTCVLIGTVLSCPASPTQ
jgi:hypothetical protein